MILTSLDFCAAFRWQIQHILSFNWLISYQMVMVHEVYLAKDTGRVDRSFLLDLLHQFVELIFRDVDWYGSNQYLLICLTFTSFPQMYYEVHVYFKLYVVIAIHLMYVCCRFISFIFCLFFASKLLNFVFHSLTTSFLCYL